MKVPNIHTLSQVSRLSLFAVVILLGALFFTVNSALQKQNDATHAAGTTNCQPDAILVNPCRPWLGSRVKGYPQAASDDKSQVLFEESKIIGKQNDIAHTFHPVGDNQLSAQDKYLATRPNGYLLTNWKPTNKWANIAQSNAAIDSMANSIKSVAPHKIFLALHHEPQNDVTNDPNCPNISYKGSAGTPTDYRNMWAYVHNRFAQDGVNNVVWVLIYQGYKPFDCLYPDLYPGNTYVDWVAVDDYGNPGKPNFADNIQHSYDLLTNDSDATHNFLSKPWAITEWNFCNSTSAEGISYYTQAKQALDSGKFPRIKAWVMFDALGTGVTQIPGCLLAYDSNRTYDTSRVNAYKAFATDPIFTSSTTAPTIQPLPTPTTKPTIRPTATPQPTNPPAPGTTVVKFTIALHGVGSGGDSANPNSQGNTNPLHPGRTLIVAIYNTQNQLILTQQGNIQYDHNSGKFTGIVNLGPHFTTSLYTVKVKTDQYLRVLVPGIQNITAGQTTTLPPVTLVAGDINGDNAINVLDYNLLSGCYSDLLPAMNCNATNNVLSDLNDDGHVNQFDYNLFLRELTNVGGQ